MMFHEDLSSHWADFDREVALPKKVPYSNMPRGAGQERRWPGSAGDVSMPAFASDNRRFFE